MPFSMNISKIINQSILGILALAVVGAAFPIVAQATTTTTNASFETRLRDFRNAQSEFIQAKKEFKEAKKDRRADKQKQVFEKQKRQLLHAVQTLITRAENLKERIVKNTAVYGDHERVVLAEIDADITKLRSLEARINAATNEEELKAIRQEIRTLRADVREAKIQKFVVLSHIGRFERAIIVKAQERADRLATKIAELKKNGKDVAALEQLLSDARTKIGTASGLVTTLKTKVNQAQTTMKLSEVREELNAIKNRLKEVYDLFRQIASRAESV